MAEKIGYVSLKYCRREVAESIIEAGCVGESSW